MRQALAMGATLLVVGVGVVPASADPVSVTDACQRTRDALSATGGTVAGAQVAVLTGQRFSHGARIVDATTGTYGLIKDDGLRPKDLKAATKYLAAPGLTAWRNAGRFYTSDLGWSASYEQARDLAIGLPADCAAAAATLVSRSGNTYQYANAGVEVDDSGRIVQWSAGGQQWRFGYAPQTVDLPSSPAPYAEWQRASQAASLNSRLRTICRTVASTVDPDPAAIDQAIRSYADPARAVPLKVRTLRKGSLIYGRDPYTKTYHAWRVYLKSGEALARRVAP